MLSAAPPTPFSPAVPAADRHALVAQARQALLPAGTLPARLAVEPWIARSWQRCLDRGLQPTQAVVFEGVSAPALRRSQELHQPLLSAARPVLEQLSRAIAGMRYFALLTDATGTVVQVQGPIDQRDRLAQAIGRVGINLAESAVGTTAISAALSELQPVWLHRGEHFFDANGRYSCAGAPLFGPDGQCMGMLDLTGVDVPERPELRHLVARSARAMEDALLAQQPHALMLRLNWPGTALGAEGDGLLALDADGYVAGCNSLARQLLPRPLSRPGAPLHCADLMALPWQQLFDAAQARGGGPTLDLPLWSGLRLQGLAMLPARESAVGAHRARAPSQASARPFADAQSAERTGSLAPLPDHAAAASAQPLAPAQQPQGGTVQTSTPPHALGAASAMGPGPAAPSTGAAPLRETESALIHQAVREARGNVAQAARALGISRATVYRKLGNTKPRGSPSF